MIATHEGYGPRPKVIASDYDLPPVEALTPRQLQCVRLAAEGLSNKEIGALLGLSWRTVHTHLSQAVQRLGVPNRHQAVNVARQRGLLPPVDAEPRTVEAALCKARYYIALAEKLMKEPTP